MYKEGKELIKVCYHATLSCGGDGWSVIVCRHNINTQEVIDEIEKISEGYFNEITEQSDKQWGFVGKNQEGIFVITIEQFKNETETVINSADSCLIMI